MNITLEMLKEILVAVWNYPAVKVIVSHVIINTVVAVAASVHVKEFNLSKLAEFLGRKILPYVTVYFTVRLFGESIGLEALAGAVWAVIEVSLLGDLMDNIAKLGIKLPSAISSFVVK